jgi:hypothetical protein
MSNNRGIYGGVPFGAIQTNFYDQQETSADGRLAYASDIDLCDAISVGEEGGVGVGYGVKIVALSGAAKRPGINDQQIILPDSSSTAADFGGMVIRTMAGNTGADGENYMREKSMATVLRKERVGGRIYVRMADAFTAGASAYWRIAERVPNSNVKVGRLCGAAISGQGTTPAVAATGTVTFTENPSDGDTLQIGSVTYKFMTSPAAANDVAIQETVYETAQNLADVINGDSGEAYAGTTSPSLDVSAEVEAGVMTLTARTAGTAGNSLALVQTGDFANVSGATLSGGVNSSTSSVTDTVQLPNVKFRSSGAAGDLALVEFVTD